MRHPSPVVRTCIGCGKRELQASLLRLQVDAAGELVMITRTPTAGRSAYLHASQGCLSGLIRSKGLGRSLRTTVGRDARQRAAAALERIVLNGTRDDVRDTRRSAATPAADGTA
ncbi:MAG: YlxR family protein [Deltaproteobacteria bacterium]|nr:YlxR family protein [Deltaproteobacteria bacterium]